MSNRAIATCSHYTNIFLTTNTDIHNIHVFHMNRSLVWIKCKLLIVKHIFPTQTIGINAIFRILRTDHTKNAHVVQCLAMQHKVLYGKVIAVEYTGEWHCVIPNGRNQIGFHIHKIHVCHQSETAPPVLRVRTDRHKLLGRPDLIGIVWLARAPAVIGPLLGQSTARIDAEGKQDESQTLPRTK